MDDLKTDDGYVKEKVFTYEIKEIIPDDEDKALYMAYDENTYIAEVKLTDDTEGKLHTEVNYRIKGSDEEPSVGDDDALEITNIYQATKLKLTKKMPKRIELPENGENATVIFKITGTDKDGNVVYTNHVGITFDQNSKDYETVTIEDVPTQAKITVEEEYSGSYEPMVEKITKKDLVEEDGEMIWVFEFENEPDQPTFGSGIVNNYEYTDGNVTYVDKKEADE